jgi:NAD(P)-dependent dehydrogenase (short-subunit alcohol dehydrogenase family)
MKIIRQVVCGIIRRIKRMFVVEIVKVCKYEVVSDNALSGRRILVTGGSSGIGLAMAKKFLAQGAEVVVTGRNAAKLEKAVLDVASPHLKGLVWDIADIGIIESKLDEAELMLGGRIDVCVNNAGVAIRQYPGVLTEAVWDSIMAINLKAPVFVAQSIVNKWMVRGVKGVVLNISSFAGVEPALDAYSSSKCALNSMVKGMARTWAMHGIRINAIAPGVVVGTDVREFQRKTDPNGNVYSHWIPMGRYGVPDEIAELAAFLVSDRAAYITGEIIGCDGAGALRQ